MGNAGFLSSTVGLRFRWFRISVWISTGSRDKEAFNPCSARDAHIMLQLKRTLEAFDSMAGLRYRSSVFEM